MTTEKLLELLKGSEDDIRKECYHTITYLSNKIKVMEEINSKLNSRIDNGHNTSSEKPG